MNPIPPNGLAPINAPLSPPKARLKSRVVVVEQVYHQQPHGQPVVVESKYTRRLDSDEQPFGPRRIRVGEEWTKPDTGWVADGGLLCLSNEEGKGLAVQPSPSERNDINSRIVEVCLVDPETGNMGGVWLVPPGESLRASAASFMGLRIRCRKGSARITFTVIPS